MESVNMSNLVDARRMPLCLTEDMDFPVSRRW